MEILHLIKSQTNIFNKEKKVSNTGIYFISFHFWGETALNVFMFIIYFEM